MINSITSTAAAEGVVPMALCSRADGYTKKKENQRSVLNAKPKMGIFSSLPGADGCPAIFDASRVLASFPIPEGPPVLDG